MLIGICGKSQAGKDTAGHIIQYLLYNKYAGINCEPNEEDFQEFMLQYYTLNQQAEIKKFADKLKDCVCVLIGCIRLDLENNDFKNKVLPMEWDRWYVKSEENPHGDSYWIEVPKSIAINDDNAKCVQMTPRSLLNMLGTDCGRNIIHPNIWVNSTFSGYKSTGQYPLYGTITGKERIVLGMNKLYPNWIITDVRFINEMDAILERQGFCIEITRELWDRYPIEWQEFRNRPNDEQTQFDFLNWLQTSKNPVHNRLYETITSKTETQLDEVEHKYKIQNVNISYMISKLNEILKLENI